MSEERFKPVGKLLREMRAEMTLRFAAKRSGLSPSHVSDIERGRRFPSRRAVEALLGVYCNKYQRKPVTTLVELTVAQQLLDEWRSR